MSEECDTLIVCSSTLLRVTECQRSNPAQRGSIIKENEYEQQHVRQSIVAELDERNHRWNHLYAHFRYHQQRPQWLYPGRTPGRWHHFRRGIPSQRHFLDGLWKKKCLRKARPRSVLPRSLLAC